MEIDSMEIRSNSKTIILLKLFCFSLCFLCTTFSAEAFPKEAHQKTVVIDAGHGGKDPGTVVGKAKEKNVVLDIALKLGKLIRQNQGNIKVVFIRDGDYFVPLMDRANIANKVNADLFISIHANYCDNPEINGTETYVLGLHRTEDNLNVAKKENSVILLEDDYSTRYEGFNPNLSESYIMFELIQDTFLDQSVSFATILQSNFKELAQRHDREVRQAGFLVLRETAMPSVLIETGYLSNKKENAFLLTEGGRSEIAQSIYGSLISYLNKLGAKDNLPAKTDKVIKPGTPVVQKQQTAKQKGKSNREFEPSTYEPVVRETKSPAVPKIAELKIAPDSTPSAVSKPSVVKSTENHPVGKKSQISSIHPDNSSAQKATEIKESDSPTPEAKLTYAIQIGVFSKKVDGTSKIFNDIPHIREIQVDGKYKYFCSESDKFQTTKSDYPEVARMFPDAFIVSIRNNQTRMVWKGDPKK